MNEQALLKRLKKLRQQLEQEQTESTEEIIQQWFDFLPMLLLNDEIAGKLEDFPHRLDYETFRASKECRQAIQTILEEVAGSGDN
ncbi:hypothetical protein [Streptococcus merionis]|uniref:Uncharacterized protein n=1 Tax=Streptococcus merionis TaxID=400065 RepID=A0A239SYS0_9STRE|nr:hypothetical protein [Streptococcus merionis]QBX08762.1 hypothetical protein JavanS294_0003 [Streptococcus satellite phage Javan294]SNU90620.1 Uncharacterised protein [Streptococcus merionis]